MDRYDDREVIKTNLIDSNNMLIEFGKKNLPDKFFLDDTINKSLRNTIVREMVSNTLMHREFSISYTAKFAITGFFGFGSNSSKVIFPCLVARLAFSTYILSFSITNFAV